MPGALFLHLAQANPPAPPPDAALQVHSVWDFVVKGGLIMVPIGLCSLVALAVVTDRILALRRSRVAPRPFVAEMQALRRTPRRALDLARRNGSPVASVLAVALRDRDQPAPVRERHMEEAGHREVVRLRQRMRLLSALPQVATMLGLLGTIFGMIRTFSVVAASGETLGRTEHLAKGIYEAWTATAAGLLVAIPTMIAYHTLMGRLDAAVAEIDRVAREWLEAEHTPAEPQDDTDEPAAALNAAPAKPGAVAPLEGAPLAGAPA
jgi:biopolymer transport protein ExbB